MGTLPLPKTRTILVTKSRSHLPHSRFLTQFGNLSIFEWCYNLASRGAANRIFSYHRHKEDWHILKSYIMSDKYVPDHEASSPSKSPDNTNTPLELHHLILAHYVNISKRDLVAYTYGLTTVPSSTWDAVKSVRQVIRSWHSWALDFALHDVHIIIGRRAKWFDVTANREKYHIYELIHNPQGAATSVDPHRDLHRTRSFFQTCPQVAHSVRRLRFRGYFTPKACLDIIAIAKICTNAAHVSLPWYIIQYANKLILESTLGSNHRQPVSSLELFAEIPDRQDRGQMLLSRPSRFRLDFSMLRRLKIRSDTDVTPLRDRDLAMIAKSARLEELYVAGLSSISIKGNYF